MLLDDAYRASKMFTMKLNKIEIKLTEIEEIAALFTCWSESSSSSVPSKRFTLHIAEWREEEAFQHFTAALR